MNVIGIDPGLSGGLCVLNDKKGIIDILKMPICSRPNRKGNYIDLEKIYEFITDYSRYNEYKDNDTLYGIFIERQFILRSQGMSSGSKTMYQSGLLYGMCFAECDNLQEINAKDWQNEIFKKVNQSKVNKYNFATDTKLQSIAYVEQNFDRNYLFTSSRQTKPSDGIADAICIASFGLTTLLTK